MDFMNLTVQKDFLEIDGKPVFIYGGDLSYCRVPRRYWKERMLQMKAAGLNTVTVYAVWAYHQETPGKFDFEGERDLAAFIDTIAECGMYCIYRMGPFVHGEFHNGGLPQWLVDELGTKARTNDPQYLKYAEEYYNKLIEIAKPRQIQNGGPIIIIQLENELGSAGCKGDDLPRGSESVEENTKHLLFYKDLVTKNGITVPVLDINHIPDKEKYFDSLVDAGGLYPVNCFYCDGDLGDFSMNWWNNHTRPKITIETGGGMFVRYYDVPAYRNTNSFQGPLVPPEMIEGALNLHLAEGCSGVNLYIFCDGQNPDDCGESMLPAKNMNYQAPISVVGRFRKSYYAVKRTGWFLRSFGQELLKSSPSDNWAKVRYTGIAHPGEKNGGDLFNNYDTIRSEEQTDTTDQIKYQARTTKGLNLSESNFLFLRNASNLGSSWKRDVKVLVTPSKLACEVFQEYPKKTQLEMPPQTLKTMPFFVRLAKGNFLEYSTAELLDKREFNGKTQVVLCDSNEIMTETRLVLPSVENIRTAGNVLVMKESPNTVTLIAKMERFPIIVETDDLRLVLMEKHYAEELWDIGSFFAHSETPLSGTEKEIKCLTETEDFCMEWMTPQKPQFESGLNNAEESYDPERSIYRISGTFDWKTPEIAWKKSYSGEDIIMTAQVGPELLENCKDVVLTLHHDGMIGYAYLDGKLVSDHAYGKFLPWEIGLRGIAETAGELKIVCTKATTCRLETAVQREMTLKFR